MLQPIAKNFKGLITISGATKSGKSQLAELLIKDQESITYIATSKPRENDPDWQKRIQSHRSRRPISWKLIEHPIDICKAIETIGNNESILIDSLGGLVEEHLNEDNYQWELFESKFLNCIIKKGLAIIIVAEESHRIRIASALHLFLPNNFASGRIKSSESIIVSCTDEK